MTLVIKSRPLHATDSTSTLVVTLHPSAIALQICTAVPVLVEVLKPNLPQEWGVVEARLCVRYRLTWSVFICTQSFEIVDSPLAR